MENSKAGDIYIDIDIYSERKIRYCKYFILPFLHVWLSKDKIKMINVIK